MEFFIAGFVIAMIAVFVAVFSVMKKGKAGPIETTKATILRTYTDEKYVNENFSSQTVVSSSSNLVKTYWVEFKIKGGKKIRLDIKKKIWLKLSDGDYGELVFQNQKLISFTPLEAKEETDDVITFKKKKTGPICFIYGQADESGFNIESKQKIEVDASDMEKLIKRLKNDESDWFFVLSKSNGDELQIERAPDDEIKETAEIKRKEEVSIYRFSKLMERITQFINE